MSIEQALDPNRPPTPVERRAELFNSLSDLIQECMDAGMEDFVIERAIQSGRETYRRARRESNWADRKEKGDG